MKIFHLPDLGEGLVDAEIHEWHVKIGDVVTIDQPLVCMETAKAVVEVPSPIAGRIKKLYGAVGDIVNTGAPLVEFVSETAEIGSVVGKLEESAKRLDESGVIIGAAQSMSHSAKAMPAVRALAKALNVDINAITPTGEQSQITIEDVKKFAASSGSEKTQTEILHGVRRAMSVAMTQSHQEIVPVTIVDDADISSSPAEVDVTALLIQAMIKGVESEPALNACFDGKAFSKRLLKEINIGLAIDTAEGLFVPVLKDVANKNTKEWRVQIEAFKQAVKKRTVLPAELQGASIALTNFGMIAGRYATPIIIPPMVAILGCGKIREVAAVHQGKIEIRRIVPLSLTIDHRAVTGGEAARFLAAVIQSLEKGLI